MDYAEGGRKKMDITELEKKLDLWITPKAGEKNGYH